MIDTHTGGLDAYLAKLGMNLRRAAKKAPSLHDAVVNAPFFDRLVTTQLGLGAVVLLLNNVKTHTVDRIALSDTEQAKGAVNMSSKPFKDIKIPNNHDENIIVKAITSDKPQFTTDWKDLFTPVLSDADARFNQAGAGIECSFVYPIHVDDGGALIFSYFTELEKIGTAQKRFMRVYSHLVDDVLGSY